MVQRLPQQVTPHAKHRILLQKMNLLERLKKTRIHQTGADNSEKGAHTDTQTYTHTDTPAHGVRWASAVRGQSKEQRSKKIAGMEGARMNEDSGEGWWSKLKKVHHSCAWT